MRAQQHDDARKGVVDQALSVLKNIYGPTETWHVVMRARAASLMRNDARRAWNVDYQRDRLQEALALLRRSALHADGADILKNGLAGLVEARILSLLGRLEHVSAGLNWGIPWDVWMMEFGGIDSIFGDGSMPKPCSLDLRERVVETVELGASRREAAERFEVSASSAIKWMQRWHETGSVAAKPSGGSISPLEERADFLLALIAEQPDLTLDEIVVAMRKRRIAGSRSAVWRFFKRHNISFKKKPAGGGARASGRGPRTAALDARTGHV